MRGNFRQSQVYDKPQPAPAMNKYIEHYAVNRGATFVFTISQIPLNYFLKPALNKRSSAFVKFWPENAQIRAQTHTVRNKY